MMSSADSQRCPDVLKAAAHPEITQPELFTHILQRFQEKFTNTATIVSMAANKRLG